MSIDLRTTVVWLDGSKNPGGPIRRRWRVYVGNRVILSIPLAGVDWSRDD